MDRKYKTKLPAAQLYFIPLSYSSKYVLQKLEVFIHSCIQSSTFIHMLHGTYNLHMVQMMDLCTYLEQD